MGAGGGLDGLRGTRASVMPPPSPPPGLETGGGAKRNRKDWRGCWFGRKGHLAIALGCDWGGAGRACGQEDGKRKRERNWLPALLKVRPCPRPGCLLLLLRGSHHRMPSSLLFVSQQTLFEPGGCWFG